MRMALAFFLSMYLKKTPLAFITPYFDQIVAVLVMVFALPESIKVLWKAIKDIFLFSPNKVYLDEVKSICYPVLEEYQFHPVFLISQKQADIYGLQFIFVLRQKL